MSSLAFNGTSDYARSGSPPVTNYPFTISCWFYPTSLAANARTCGLFDSAGTSIFGQIVTTTGALRTGVSNASGTNSTADTTNTTTANVWAHGASVFISSTSRRSILNGVVANAGVTSSSNAPGTPNRLSMGAGDGNVQNLYFPGQIGETAIWNIRLPDEEVTALAKGWSPFKIKPHALVFHAPYLGLGTTIADRYGAPLTITGAVTSVNTPPFIGHP